MAAEMNILLVEDNDLDVELLKRGLRRLGIAGKLVRAKDGVDALDLLQSDLVTASLPTPYVILLDINMPRMNGHEFLEAVRAAKDLRHAQVVMFTTSDNPKDINLAHQNNANAYIVKPNSSSELREVLAALQGFWSICEPPAPSSARLV